MVVYVFTKKEAALKTIFPKNAQFLPLPLSDHAPESGDITYVDVSALDAAEIKKTLAQLKKCCGESPWGVIDPKGSVKDPAELFFEGACDYLGSGLLKDADSIDPKRFKEALTWRKNFVSAAASAKDDAKSTGENESIFPKTGIKLPSASAFPGWNKMQAGKTMPFYLLYCSMHGKIALDSRFNETVIAQIHKRFLGYMVDNLQKTDGLLWIDSGKDCLFLLPPKAKPVEAAIKACIRMIISAPLFTLETLAITMPLNFVFALHYGSLSYKPPGRTGTIVSDAVNFIFHLGTKKSEPGRLTISGELPDGSIPKSLEDWFVSAGEFEDRKIWHTRKFNYAKPWV